VEAGKYVAVSDHGPRTTITGGVIITIPKPASAEAWCEFHGVEVVDGVATLYKAVGDNYASSHGMAYPPGSTRAAPDWDGGQLECGGGLHFSPRPSAALQFAYGAKRYVGCPVRLDEIVVHPDGSYPEKVKAPRVVEPGCFECDIDGKPLQPADAAT